MLFQYTVSGNLLVGRIISDYITWKCACAVKLSRMLRVYIKFTNKLSSLTEHVEFGHDRLCRNVVCVEEPFSCRRGGKTVHAGPSWRRGSFSASGRRSLTRIYGWRAAAFLLFAARSSSRCDYVAWKAEGILLCSILTWV